MRQRFARMANIPHGTSLGFPGKLVRGSRAAGFCSGQHHAVYHSAAAHSDSFSRVEAVGSDRIPDAASRYSTRDAGNGG